MIHKHDSKGEITSRKIWSPCHMDIYDWVIIVQLTLLQQDSGKHRNKSFSSGTEFPKYSQNAGHCIRTIIKTTTILNILQKKNPSSELRCGGETNFISVDFGNSSQDYGGKMLWNGQQPLQTLLFLSCIFSYIHPFRIAYTIDGCCCHIWIFNETHIDMQLYNHLTNIKRLDTNP